MNKAEKKELLIDYVEGTIGMEKKTALERLLRESAQTHDELEKIQNVFSVLSRMQDETVPPHYFTSFLPNVRHTVEHSKGKTRFVIPSWLPSMVRPGLSFIVILTLIGFYDFLQPGNSSNEMFEIVREISRSNSLPDIAQEMTLFQNENGMPVIDSETQTEVLANEIIASNAVDENIVSDRQILSQLDDSQIEYILDQLPSVQ
ncbi:MAG: hypothetical protein WCT99_03130 [Bacteroidota bacterium]|jgi:hypothetical protein